MPEVLIPKDAEGRDMSPVEARTGVVLPIWSRGEGKTNRHHGHFRKQDYLNGPRKHETRAVRSSRLQTVRKGPHRGYHEQFSGTEFPRDVRQSCGIVLFNLAHYVPPYVVDMSTPTAKIIETTPEISEELRGSEVFTLEKSRKRKREIGQFIMNCSIWQDFDSVKQLHIEQFLELTNKRKVLGEEFEEEKYQKLGSRLINIAIGLAVHPIDKTFQEARRQQAVKDDAPVCAFKLAKDFLEGRESDYFPALGERLADYPLKAA